MEFPKSRWQTKESHASILRGCADEFIHQFCTDAKHDCLILFEDGSSVMFSKGERLTSDMSLLMDKYEGIL